MLCAYSQPLRRAPLMMPLVTPATPLFSYFAATLRYAADTLLKGCCHYAAISADLRCHAISRRH
jgi:hypothetical protein